QPFKMAPKANAKVASSTTRKTKKSKDPNAIKKPLSAYMYFSQAQREQVKLENPEAGFGDVGRLLGAKWKQMTDDQKRPYVAQADADKARHEREKAARA
ncbi:hypothetical protein K437DRAFT_218621, partial [Tilletiaria anomala UBC 951]